MFQILSLYDLSGIMVKPWANAGYQCLIVDVEHPSGFSLFEENITALGCDLSKAWNVQLLKTVTHKVQIGFAFPPCTHLALSGRKFFHEKGLPALIEALTLVQSAKSIFEDTGYPWMIENPLSTLSTYWRKPDAIFDPCDFACYLNPPGDLYKKRTCLWVGNDFKFPTPKPAFPILGSLMQKIPGSKNQARIRSVTPTGFSQAVFERNCNCNIDF